MRQVRQMNKTVKMMVIMLVVLLLGGTVATVVFLNIGGKNEKEAKASITDMVEYSYETPEMTTDLEDGSFVKIQFRIITDGKNARKEIEQREFQIKNILIKELGTLNEQQFKSGLPELENKMKVKLNEVMQDGKVTDVYTVNKILQ